MVTPELLAQTAHEVGENTILSRTGGAPTLAVGMAQIFSQLVPGEGMTAFWYHYAILFEALFILTTVDAGTRVGRFMIQDLLGTAVPALRHTDSWTGNLVATALCVGGWGWFLYQGVVDPLGGINTLWPLFGIANQMLAGMALTYCTVALVRSGRGRFAWITALPASWVLVCTVTAGAMKVFSADPRIGFLAHARRFGEAAGRGEVLAPARDLAQMQQVVVNDYVNAGLALLFMTVMLITVAFGVRAVLHARRAPGAPSSESPYVALAEGA